MFYCSINFIYVQICCFYQFGIWERAGRTRLYFRTRHWAEREAPEPAEMVGRIHARGSRRQRRQRSSQPGHHPELHCSRTFRAVPLRSLLQVYIQAAIISGEKKVPFLAVYCGFSSLCLLKPRHCRKDEQFPQISLCVVLFLIIQLCLGQQSNKHSHLTEL